MMNRRKFPVKALIFLILFIGIFKSLFTISANPPWQTADEVTHYEAAWMYGMNGWGDVPGTADGTVQRALIRSLDKYRFWERVGVPQPRPLPTTFSDTDFLRDSPSKLGRQPLYYRMAGFFLAVGRPSLVAGLVRLRLLNVLIAIFAVLLIGWTSRSILHNSAVTTIIAQCLILFNAGLWQIMCGVNIEAVSLFLNALGLSLALLILERGITVPRLAAFGGWIAAIALLRWTLLISAIPIIFLTIPLSLRAQPGSRERRHPALIFIAPAIILSGALLTVAAVSRHSLLWHELNHGLSGLKNLLHHSAISPKTSIPILFKTFWAGFGWLTVPVPAVAIHLYLAVTILILLTCFRFPGRVRRKRISSGNILLVSVLFMTSIMVIIRASSDQPAIQGRYFIPAVPALIFLFANRMNSIRRTRWKSGLAVMIVMLVIPAAIIAELGGWFTYQNNTIPDGAPLLQNLAAMEWDPPCDAGLLLDLRDPGTRIFLQDGWYPPDSNLRWFRKRGTIRIPMISRQPLECLIRAMPFQPPGSPHRFVTVSFNGDQVFTGQLEPRWNEIRFRLNPEQIGSGINTITMDCSTADSPLSAGLSQDARVISVGIRSLIIAPADHLKDTTNRMSNWTYTGGKFTLHVVPGDGFRLRRSGSTDIMIATDSDRVSVSLNARNSRYIATRPIDFPTIRQPLTPANIFNRLLTGMRNADDSDVSVFLSWRWQFLFLILYLAGALSLILAAIPAGFPSISGRAHADS